MDLKTYAVHRKLEADSELLSYVVKGNPIPVSLVEENFRDYLEPLSDPAATRLIEDYAGLIGDEIPVVTRQLDDGGYSISGEIPDRLVEAIQLVHEVTPEEIVSALVNHNTAMVHGESLSITDIDLTGAARQTLLDSTRIPKVEPAVLSSPNLFEGAEEKEKPTMAPVAEETPTAEETPAAEETPSVAEAVTEEPPVAETRQEDVPAEAFADDEDAAAEAFDDEEDLSPEEDKGAAFRQAVNRVYQRVVADIQAMRLDQRLNLAM